MRETYLPEDKQYMESLAREAVETFIKTGKTIKANNVPEPLNIDRACFVTLKSKGQLRGCIGTLEPAGKLCDSIIEMAIAAATRDHRFPPVTGKELPEIDYEISVLTEAVEVEYATKEDLFRKISGKGLIIQKGYNKATYLPQVWEMVRDEEEFLSSLCSKAGLRNSEWKQLQKSGIKYSVYETIK